jgi:hypothetical protein
MRKCERCGQRGDALIHTRFVRRAGDHDFAAGPPRKRGSVRFDPYFKIQRWSVQALAWIDIQQAYSSEEKARAAASGMAGMLRLMRVEEGGRAPAGYLDIIGGRS